MTYAPRLVVGSRFGTPHIPVGLRHGLILHLLLDIVEIEMSHQVLGIGDALEHDLRGTFSINCGLIILAAYALRG